MMGIKKGTKLKENPKNKTFKVRLDEDTFNKLEYLSEKTKKSKSDIVRDGIEIQYNNQK